MAFVALPGVVAFLVPAWMAWRMGLRVPSHPAGVAVGAVGTIALLWCVRDFYVAGKGTLAPWAPPERLVVVGLYRWSRNPMYVAVLLLLVGWGVLFQSAALGTYAGVVALSFHLRVLFHEEPTLARRHGAAWEEYSAQVPRWFGRPRCRGLSNGEGPG